LKNDGKAKMMLPVWAFMHHVHADDHLPRKRGRTTARKRQKDRTADGQDRIIPTYLVGNRTDSR
jgi:hypothetical protein